jgi:hypothetical protein
MIKLDKKNQITSNYKKWNWIEKNKNIKTIKQIGISE